MHRSSLLCLLLATITPSESSHSEVRSPHQSRPRAERRDPGVTLSSRAACEPADPTDNVAQRLNQLLKTGGPGYTLSLCPNQNYPITAPLQFTAPNQEISTQGSPTDDSRAMLTISGPLMQPNQADHTTAVQGQCEMCNGVKLRHIQVNGTRLGAPAVKGGANIEMGGPTSGQIVEHVRSFDPRSWSCLHIAEGDGLKCSNALVQNNYVGPCGSDSFDQWSDGISIACARTIVKNNLIRSATDGGVVIFGAPGTLVENNTIWIETRTLLGGINLVDYDPWSGNYDGTVVRQNRIVGGLATNASPGAREGTNSGDAIIKIGIAIGPRVWFGNHYLANVSRGGTVQGNRFEGAFGFATAISSAFEFRVRDNILVGNTSFIGTPGPNCTAEDIPKSQPFVAQQDKISRSSLQSDFANVQDADSLTCIVPTHGNFWPIGGSHSPTSPPPEPEVSEPPQTGMSVGAKFGLGFGIVVAIILFAILIRSWRRRVVARRGW